MRTPTVTAARSPLPALLTATVLTAAVLTAAVILAAPLGAQDTIPPPAAQRQHVVRPGDTLWELARAYLRDPFLWPLLFDANRALLGDPDLILPAQRLLIPVTKPGEPAGAPVGTPLPEAAQVAPERVDTVPDPPDAPEPPPASFAVRPGEYASAPWLADTAALRMAGRIVRLADPADADGNLPSVLHPFDRVLVGQLRPGAHAVGDSLLAVRVGDEVDGWGRKVFPMAVLRVDTVAGAVLGARVVHQYADARVGDLVLVDVPRPGMPRGQPLEVEDGPTGTILAFARERPLQSTLHQGFIDMGATLGIGLGDEFEVFTPAAGGVPPQVVARLRVIRVESASATVLVTELQSRALAAGLPVRLIRRMQ